MPRDLSIADRCRAAGLRVSEVAGWQTRGDSTFNPRGSVNHHTAGGSSGTAPSLRGVIYGFHGSAPGPLAHALQSREPDGRDIFYIVAAGRANHAGSGGWRGLTGNSSVFGLEIEHNGVTPLSEHRQRLAARFHAAMAKGRWDERMVCQHREWAPTRKIDAATGVLPDRFRAFVREALNPAPIPIPEPEPPARRLARSDMDAIIIQCPNDTARPPRLYDGTGAPSCTAGTVAGLVATGIKKVDLDAKTYDAFLANAKRFDPPT